MIDWTKPVETADGKKVVIFTTKAKGKKPIVGQVKGEDFIRAWPADGSNDWVANSLVNVKETITRWVNFYPTRYPWDYNTKDEADKNAAPNRIACIKVEFKEGEGL